MNKDQLYLDLKKRILTMVMEPGESLDEKSLSEQYSISRTPLRDVFRRLAGEGYLTLVSNKGASVSSMNHKTMRDFFITAPMVYASIGKLAAENAKDDQVEAMKTANVNFNQSIENNDPLEVIYWNDRFHVIMGDMADNAYLKPSYDRLLIDHARISQTFYRSRDPDMQQRMETASSHHKEMIAAIESGNSKAVVELILAHWELSKDRLNYFVRPDPLPLID
ncbi:MAG: DNA-binding GntR family transcriptional regulator [Polaribacter sp.]|jgi:DNA-binding GntR family transcriptional regulator